MDNVFVIGDTHGHLDRLESLLKQEGLWDRCEGCDGGGEIDLYQDAFEVPYNRVDCPTCDGEGWVRLRPYPEVTIVHVGDVGHFGHHGSPTGDILTYKYVTVNRWADVVLWGNHDRAAIDNAHHADDFLQVPEARNYIGRLWEEGRMQMAFAAHGFLITHAGLAAAFEQQGVDEKLKIDPEYFADWINDEDEKHLERTGEVDPSSLAIINAIGRIRGGRVPTGGILWRDIEEKLYEGFRQIFGHSADPEHQVRYCIKDIHTRHPENFPHTDDWNIWSYCIDVGGKGERPGDACLAGIWLPSEKIVRIDL